MSVRRGFLNWGIFFVCLGAVPLAVQLGVVDASAAAELFRLWPLILIGIGLGILLRLTRYHLLGGVVVAGTFGILFGALLAGGVTSAAAVCGGPVASGPTTNRSGAIDGSSIDLSVELTCAELDVSRVPGGQWTVDVVGADEPTINSTGSYLELRSDNTDTVPFVIAGTREGWNVNLPDDASLTASMTFTATSARLNLGSGAVSSLSTTFNATDGRLDLSGAGVGDRSLSATVNASSVIVNLAGSSFDGSMTVNAGSLHLCTAAADGVRITYNDTLSSNDFASAGLVDDGQAWQTPDFAQSATAIDLRLTANVSSVTLDRSGGCQ
jgi:hypothetical protein